MIIDVHSHVGLYGKHLSETFIRIIDHVPASTPSEELKKMWDTDPDSCITDMDEAGIDKAVIMGMDLTRVDPTYASVDYIYDLMQWNDRL